SNGSSSIRTGLGPFPISNWTVSVDATGPVSLRVVLFVISSFPFPVMLAVTVMSNVWLGWATIGAPWAIWRAFSLLVPKPDKVTPGLISIKAATTLSPLRVVFWSYILTLAMLSVVV